MSRILIIIIFISISACAFVPRDITNSRDVENLGWVKGKTYSTAKPVFLINDEYNGRYYISRSNTDHLSDILAHQCGSTVLPRSIQEFESSPKKWSHVTKVLPSGTKVKFIQAYSYGDLDRTVRLVGVLEDHDSLEVWLGCISIYGSKTGVGERDQTWLLE
ncbi:MAG: hypothetical protein AB2556_02075 [Candidatus Thiodiazotropha sp.]